MYLFRSVAPIEVQRALEASATATTKENLDDWRNDCKSKLARIRVAYKGGAGAVEMLMKKFGEQPAEWDSRRWRFQNVPVTKRVLDKLNWLVWGQPPQIETWIGDKPPSVLAQLEAIKKGEAAEVDETSQRFNDWVQNTLEENRFWSGLMMRGGIGQLKDGRAPLKIWPMPDFEYNSMKGLRLDFFQKEDVKPVYDPSDPEVLLGVYEFTVMDGRWKLYTTDEVVYVDAGGTVEGDAGDHPVPGVIPWAFLGCGDSWAEDLIGYQYNLINAQSEMAALGRSTAFPVPVFKGNPSHTERTDPITGVKFFDFGTNHRYIHFPDPTGGFEMVNADAPISELRDAYESLKREAIELGGSLPAELGGMGDGSPSEMTATAAMQRWHSAFAARDTLIQDGTCFIDQMMHVIVAYGDQYGGDFDVPGYDVDAVDWDVNWTRNPIAHDDREERDIQMREVSADLRPKSMYVSEKVMPNATPDELADALEELEANAGGIGGRGMPTAPNFGEEDEGA